MWLHVPLRALPSAPALAASNSAFISPNPDTELCVMSSRKLMRRPLSSPVWKTRPWIQRLSGTMLNPSTAENGVERWISSLPDIPASRSRRLASSSAKRTRGTSGRISGGSSRKSGRATCSSRTSPTTSVSASLKSRESFDAWATAARRDCLQRQKSAQARAESACSAWPTPTASMSDCNPVLFAHKGGDVFCRSSSRRTQKTLTRAAALWSAEHLDGATFRSTPLGRVISMGGERSFAWNRVFSPAFGELMMGWPIGWTAIDSSVMGYHHWLQRMRGELSRLNYE